MVCGRPAWVNTKREDGGREGRPSNHTLGIGNVNGIVKKARAGKAEEGGFQAPRRIAK